MEAFPAMKSHRHCLTSSSDLVILKFFLGLEPVCFKVKGKGATSSQCLTCMHIHTCTYVHTYIAVTVRMCATVTLCCRELKEPGVHSYVTAYIRTYVEGCWEPTKQSVPGTGCAPSLLTLKFRHTHTNQQKWNLQHKLFQPTIFAYQPKLYVCSSDWQ